MSRPELNSFSTWLGATSGVQVGNVTIRINGPGYVRSGSMKIPVLSEFKSAMPRSDLNSLPTRLGAIRLGEEVSSVRVQVGNATHPRLWPGPWFNHFVCLWVSFGVRGLQNRVVCGDHTRSCVGFVASSLCFHLTICFTAAPQCKDSIRILSAPGAFCSHGLHLAEESIRQCCW